MSKNESPYKANAPTHKPPPVMSVVDGGNSGQTRPLRRRFLIGTGIALFGGAIWFWFDKFFKSAPLPPAPTLDTLTITSPKPKQYFWLKGDEVMTFEWSGQTTSIATLQIATDRNFTNIIDEFDDVNSPCVVHGLKHDASYFWRLSQKISTGQIAFTEIHELFIGEKAPPVPVAPQTGTRLPLRRALISWREKPHVDRYRVQLAMDSHFSDVVRDLTVGGANRYQMSDLPPGRYYWRVSVHDHKALKNLWSEGRSIIISNDRRSASYDESE